VTISGNAATITVSGAAIYEANGQYNNVDAAPASGAVVTILGAASTLYQPNMFYTKQAFGLGTVKLPKLYSTDTIATTSDGMSIRVSKYADGDANTQKIRFDLSAGVRDLQPAVCGSRALRKVTLTGGWGLRPPDSLWQNQVKARLK